MEQIDYIKIDQQVEIYLNDNDKLYNDWYEIASKINEDPDTIPFAIIPPVTLIKKRFKEWFYKSENFIREEICIKYIDRRKKIDEKKALVVALITDCLSLYLQMPTVISTITILVVDNYLDKLCIESDNNGR